MENKYNIAYKNDLKIKNELVAWPLIRLSDDKPVYQPIPANVPIATPIRHEVTYVDLDTGEVTEGVINHTLKTYFNAIGSQFRRRHWSAEIQLVPELKIETQYGLRATESAVEAPNDYSGTSPTEKIQTVFTTGIFELIDLRYGLKNKPEFFPYYNQVITNLANIAAIELEHLADGFYGFTQKSVSVIGPKPIDSSSAY